MTSKSTVPFEIYALRLGPNDDLKKSLLAFAKIQELKAACLISAVGSLKVANLRFAQAQTGARLEGPFEIVSLSGTLSEKACHLHISIADSEGQVRGGHLLDECLIYTTCELVLLEDKTRVWDRSHDPATGYRELKILKRNNDGTTGPAEKGLVEDLPE